MATKEEEWKALALKSIGVIVEYDKLVVLLNGDENHKTQDTFHQLRELMRKLRDDCPLLGEVLFIP